MHKFYNFIFKLKNINLHNKKLNYHCKHKIFLCTRQKKIRKLFFMCKY